jgi:ribosomal protein S12 methylthiotransferase
LGCSKNQVDTERMLALAQGQGLTLVNDPSQAEVILVNTCGFIGPAKEESIDAVLEMAQYKHEGRCRALIMAGCLTQRYSAELAEEMPEVDHFLGTADLPRLAALLKEKTGQRLAVGQPNNLSEAGFERTLIGARHRAYLKISEGCNRPCAFCSIPLMRGRQRSRTIASLVQEARALVTAGVRELNLIAQDSTAYGRDLGRDVRLPALLEALHEIDQLVWIRLHYAYPTLVDDSLAATIAALSKCVPYLDLPIQHVDDDVLRRMRRGYGRAQLEQILDRLRQQIPGIFLRTTLLVGHPGESEAAFEELLSFLQGAAFDHLGVFPFSVEEGTAAARQGDQVDSELAHERADQVMALQRAISAEKLNRVVGHTIDVMVDGPSDESEYLLQGRHAGQAPDVDGVVVLSDAPPDLLPGQVVCAEVTASGDYDLIARVLPG